MKKLPKYIIRSSYKMIQCKDGSTRGPLYSMKNFSNSSSEFEINMCWFDNSSNIRYVRNHIVTLLDYLDYNLKTINKALKIADIKKSSINNLSGYKVTIRFYL